MLFEPYQLKDLQLRNRLVMAPMTTYSSNEDFTISEEELRYYHERSKTIGMVITAAVSINDSAQAFPRQITIKSDDYIPSMKALADAIHEGGAKAVIQLHHGGRMNDPSLYEDKDLIVSASAVKAPRDTLATPKAMTEEEIYQTVDDFKAAVVRAIKAGFDGVELHGANTYLLQQFFSPHSNRRDDVFGGSVHKRMTFPLMLISAAREAIDNYAQKPFILGYRFSPEELETPGITLEDTLKFVETLKDTKLDYLHVSLGHYRQTSIRNKDDEQLVVNKIQEVLNHEIPLIGVGGIETKKEADDALSIGYDMIALGLGILVDPYIGETLKEERIPEKHFSKRTQIPTLLYERLLKNKDRFMEKGYTFEG